MRQYELGTFQFSDILLSSWNISLLIHGKLIYSLLNREKEEELNDLRGIESDFCVFQ